MSISTDLETAKIKLLTIATSIEDFRGQVLRRPAECIGGVVLLHIQLAKTEVAECDVSSVVEKNVFWLQISVDHVELMQVLKSEKQLRRVEPTALFVEPLLLL